MTHDPEAAERLATMLEVADGCQRNPVACDAAALIRAQAAEIERLKATYTPGHTDMMVSPESLDAWIEDNPPPAPQPDADEREAMVAVIEDALSGPSDGRCTALIVADALIVAGWTRKREEG